MKSRAFVTEKFCWSHYYYYLTNEGIEYLREYLHLPEEVVPTTLKKAAPRPQAARPGGFGGARRPFQGKEAAPGGGDFKPTFDQGGGGERQYYSRGAPQGGLGRGQAPQQ